MRYVTLGVIFVLTLSVGQLHSDDTKGAGSGSASTEGSGSTSTKPPDAGDQFVTTNVLIGQLNGLNVEAKTFTLKVTTRNLVANPQAQADLQRAQQDLAAAAKVANPQQRAQKIADAEKRIAQAEQNQFKVEEKSQDVQCQMHDNMLVRTQILPAFFDGKGNPRKPTDDELKDLQQPQGAPGYRAALSDLQNNQTVEVFFGSKKGDTAKPSPGSGSGSGSASPSDPKQTPRQTAILILIGKSGK